MADDARFYVGPPDRPDKYRLKRQVGGGGEALLWEAELDVSGEWEPVAIKVLRTERFAALDSWRTRWAEQAELLRFVRHPGVVGVREHFEGAGMHYRGEQPAGPGGLYLAMNWVQGPTMRDWTLAHRSTADRFEALTYLAQIGDVLDWLHSGQATPSGRPIIHADVTPNNVIITPAGQAVLVDFGLTRLAAGLSATIEGTGGYLAPEVKAAGAYSPASDRYAFGALTYFVLTGAAAPAGLPAIRAGLTAAASASDEPGSIDHLMQMFDPDPHARPACGEWIRTFKVTGATFVDAGGRKVVSPSTPGTTGPNNTQFAPVAAATAFVVTQTKRARRTRVLVIVLASVLTLGAGTIVVAAALRSTGKSAGATTEPRLTVDTTPPVTDVATTASTSTIAATTTTALATTTTTIHVATTTTVPGPEVPSCVPNCFGVNLQHANLVGLNLTNVDFGNADLTTANLTDANLAGAKLGGTKLLGVTANGANFAGSYAVGYQWSGSKLRGANFSAANLKGAYMLAVDLTGANLRNADLSGAYLQSAVLTNADLSGADLTGATTFGTGDISGVILTGTIMPDGSIHP